MYSAIFCSTLSEVVKVFLVFYLRKLMYIFQEMIDTERDYVKSLQYIMDVSQLRFLRIQFFISIWVFVVL